MTTGSWLTKNEQRAWTGWMRVSRLVDSALDQQLRRDAGITHSTYAILAGLSAAPQRTLRMADIASMTNSSQSRLSHAVDRMETAGWVIRTRNPDNQREVLAVLTDAGLKLLAAVAPAHVAWVRRLIFDQLTAQQVQQLTEIGEVVLAALAEDGVKMAAAKRAGE